MKKILIGLSLSIAIFSALPAKSLPAPTPPTKVIPGSHVDKCFDQSKIVWVELVVILLTGVK